MKENDVHLFDMGNVVSRENDPEVVVYCAITGNALDIPKDIVTNPCSSK
jgi:hypothetical protein